MDGTMADYPFGVDKISMKVDLEQKGDLSVARSSDVEAWADIPIFFPDVLFRSQSRTLESRGIPK